MFYFKGLILYNGQHHGGNGDFISFGLREGVPEFRFDVGSGTGIVQANQPVSMGEWHTVQLHRNKKLGRLLTHTKYILEVVLSNLNFPGLISIIHGVNGFFTAIVQGCSCNN